VSRDDTKVRLGGMALANGVLVHGPRYWACAVRVDGGSLKVASGKKPLRAAESEHRLLRGPLRMAEIFLLLPAIRRALPEARLPFQRPAVAGALVGSAVAIRAVRSTRLSPVAQEFLAALLAVAPAAASMRRTELAEYHGAEHVAIGSYEHGEPRPREHERCGSHVLGPLLVTTATGSALASVAPAPLRPLARLAASVGALAASVELFSWMVANEKHPVARALAKPGHELQHRVLTAEPSAEQLEVAEAALRECLRLESPANGHRNGQEEGAPPT
jgi:uncharacterized protein YqhQ